MSTSNRPGRGGQPHYPADSVQPITSCEVPTSPDFIGPHSPKAASVIIMAFQGWPACAIWRVSLGSGQRPQDYSCVVAYGRLERTQGGSQFKSAFACGPDRGPLLNLTTSKTNPCETALSSRRKSASGRRCFRGESQGFLTRQSLGLQQLREPSASGAGDLGEREERHVELAAFEARDVGAIHPGGERKGFLG